ncbi:methyltransferase domain-containing protein [Bdellovibrio bacteriovorus]|uniref:class I SAM-dependent methyltransferase n=2 Tax=Bdellovibrio TaxID=958 RepID=UPI0035A66853
MSQDKKLTDNRDGYNAWSKFYDQYPNPTVAMDELSFANYWQNLGNKNVLEIGCGTGRNTEKLAAKGNHILGVDVSEGMLQVAREKFPPEDNRVKLVHGDFMTLTEFPGAPFDAVVSSLVLEHIENLSAYFKKVASLLKPQGEVFLSEIHPERTAKGVLAHFKTPDEQEIHLTSHPHTEEQIDRAAALAGFSIEKCETIYGNEELAQIHPKWSRHLGQPMLQIWVLKKS